MAAELNCVKGTRNSVRNVPTGKTGLPFRFSTYSGNFPVGRADETFSTYCRTEISGNFDEMQSALDLRRSFPDPCSRTDPRTRTLHSPQVSLTRQKLRWWPLVKGLCTLPKFLSLCKATLIYPFALSFDLGFLFLRVI